jgi:tRNA A-37 threonylcarbamoyl transferase component Bud32
VNASPLADAEVLSASRRGGLRRQLVLKIEHRGTPLVVKCYGRKRGAVRTATRAFGCWLLGKSSPRIEARFRTESQVLALWRREGFDVPELVPLDLSDEIPGPYLVMEWIPGAHLGKALRGPRLSADAKREAMARFGAACGARHARAVETNEPRLLCDHPSVSHVLLADDRLVHIDFELVRTRTKSLDRLARREIVRFLSSISSTIGDEIRPVMEAFVAAYPDASRLERTRDDLARRGRRMLDLPAIRAFLEALEG